jgi:hypothetical protein
MKTVFTVAALFLCAVAGASAATPSLGFLTTEGSFQLDQSKLWGTATIFEGSVVETKVASCRIHLSSGAEINLAPESRARFFAGRAVIEKGALRLESPAGYRVEARSFRLSSDAAHTVAAVKLQSGAGVAASASSGRLLVANASGMVVADVAPGKAVTVTPETDGVTGLTKLSGCVQSVKQSIVLVDQASNISFGLRGGGIESSLGSRVEVTGKTQPPSVTPPGSLMMVDVTQVKVLEVDACVAVGKSSKGKSAGKIGVLAGTVAVIKGAAVAVPTSVAVIGGVAVAGGIAGKLALDNDRASDQPAGTSR